MAVSTQSRLDPSLPIKAPFNRILVKSYIRNG
jgi:hypothetical protein